MLSPLCRGFSLWGKVVNAAQYLGTRQSLCSSLRLAEPPKQPLAGSAALMQAVASAVSSISTVAKPSAGICTLRATAFGGPFEQSAETLTAARYPDLEHLTLSDTIDRNTWISCHQSEGHQTNPGELVIPAGNSGFNAEEACLDLPKLKTLHIDQESHSFSQASLAWLDGHFFSKLMELERFSWSDMPEGQLSLDIGGALPGLAKLRALTIHAAAHCPNGLSSLKELQELDVVVAKHGYAGSWDLSGLVSLRKASFSHGCWGNCKPSPDDCPHVDSSLVALEELSFDGLEVVPDNLWQACSCCNDVPDEHDPHQAAANQHISQDADAGSPSYPGHAPADPAAPSPAAAVDDYACRPYKHQAAYEASSSEVYEDSPPSYTVNHHCHRNCHGLHNNAPFFIDDLWQRYVLPASTLPRMRLVECSGQVGHYDDLVHYHDLQMYVDLAPRMGPDGRWWRVSVSTGRDEVSEISESRWVNVLSDDGFLVTFEQLE